MSDERDDLRPYWPGAFKVGDRVRVRLSGECFCSSLKGHDKYDGVTGQITRIAWPFANTPFGAKDKNRAHHFVVVWKPLERDAPHGGHFAAAELEPFDA